MQLRQEINTLANQLFGSNQAVFQKAGDESQLLSLCLELMGLSHFAHCDRVTGLLYEGKQAERYSGVLALRAWLYACEKYVAKGDFASLFEAAYNQKAKGREQEYLKETQGENQKLKLLAVKDCLKALAKARGIKLKLSETNINFLNKKSLEAFMLDRGFNAQDVEMVKKVLGGSFMVSDSQRLDNDENEELLLSDRNSTNEFYAREAADIDGCSYLDKARTACKGTKKEQLRIYLMTYGAFKSGETAVLYEEDFDQDFFNFLETAATEEEIGNPAAAIAAYTNKAYDTIRKDIVKIRKVVYAA